VVVVLVITDGLLRPVLKAMLATLSAIAISAASACCVGMWCWAGSAS
jgi:hypothetical protein